ncbi:hypothetical protein [Prosthecobacter fusiformis]|nr:hypothetical protein [Prosthecobacter fusiformis]
MIAVFLALNVNDAATLSKDADGVGLNDIELADLAAKNALLNAEVKALQKLPAEDGPALKRAIEALKASVLRLSADTFTSESVPLSDPDREAQIEKQNLLTHIEEIKRAQEETSRRVTDAATQMAEVENQVKEAESRLLKTRDRSNVLRLIPERSDTSKEPVLILVQQPPWIIQRFDGGPSRTAYSIPEMLENLSSFSPATHYLVFYFKPSGAQHFDGVTSRARHWGYEIGYDLIPEEIQLEFK